MKTWHLPFLCLCQATISSECWANHLLILVPGSTVAGATYHFLPWFPVNVHAVCSTLDCKLPGGRNAVGLIVKPPKAPSTEPSTWCSTHGECVPPLSYNYEKCYFVLFVAWWSSSTKPSLMLISKKSAHVLSGLQQLDMDTWWCFVFQPGYNLHTVKCMHLKCTAWLFTYIYLLATTSWIKI